MKLNNIKQTFLYHYIYSFFCFYYAKLLFFFENTKRNGQKSKNETY